MPQGSLEAKLSPADVDAFLEYLFRNVARKPKPITLREAAGVARYLRALARETEPGPVRHGLEHLASTVWGTVFQLGRFKTAKKHVLGFLDSHLDTYLAIPNSGLLREHVELAAAPTRFAGPLPAPNLLGPTLSGQGNVRMRERSDLSERIYAGYWALRVSGVYRATARIAQALNKVGIQTEARAGTDRGWGAAEVRERVRQFNSRFKTKHGANWRGARATLTALWVRRFLDARSQDQT